MAHSPRTAVLATTRDENGNVPAGLGAFKARRNGKRRTYVPSADRAAIPPDRFDTGVERAMAAFCVDPRRMLAETALLDFPSAPEPAG